jgi:hypothetical protein
MRTNEWVGGLGWGVFSWVETWIIFVGGIESVFKLVRVREGEREKERGREGERERGREKERKREREEERKRELSRIPQMMIDQLVTTFAIHKLGGQEEVAAKLHCHYVKFGV